MNIYIYPTYTPSRDKSGNLYIKFFHEAFKKKNQCQLVNRCWKIGVSSILFNLDAQFFIIQWIDLIPFKRFGKIQFCVFIISILLLKILKKKIIWVLHNKRAHDRNSRLVDLGMAFMAKYSTKIITHSEEGVSFFNQYYPKYKGKAYYIPHPIYTEQIFTSDEIVWDYIIWGTITPRKKILEFVQYAIKEPFFQSKKIIICGKCNNTIYDNEIKKHITNNFTYINKFLSDEELSIYIKKSKCILFTYNAESLLSSGALIYSLNYCKPIIGPNAGNFIDLKNIVTCYKTFDEIPYLKINFDYNHLLYYIQENTWDKLPDKIITLLQYKNIQ